MRSLGLGFIYFIFIFIIKSPVFSLSCYDHSEISKRCYEGQDLCYITQTSSKTEPNTYSRGCTIKAEAQRTYGDDFAENQCHQEKSGEFACWCSYDKCNEGLETICPTCGTLSMH